jgi:hypothetical protein
MRRYTADEEERVRTSRKVRDWAASGLLTADQGQALTAGLRTDLKRTNAIFRAVLFLFGTLIVWALAGLVVVNIDANEEASVGVVAIVLGVGYFAAADFLVARARLYRFGIEEALASWSAAFVGGGVALLAMSAMSGRDDLAIVFGLLTASAASYVIYARYGYLYAALAAVACAAAMPFFFDRPQSLERVLSAAILAATVVAARAGGRGLDDEDCPGDDYGAIETGAWVGLYVVVNLVWSSELTFGPSTLRGVSRSFYWVTYGAIWIVPAIVLYLGVSAKRRLLTGAGLFIALATLVTNKTYLGWPHQTWDPILLGLLLAGGGAALRRWLATGEGGQRFGFTPDRILASHQRTVDALATVAGAGQSAVNHTHPAPEPAPAFDVGHGGRSGGAGAGGSF